MEKAVFIVGWDIPKEPAWRRIYFYKKLRKLREGYGLGDRVSKKSVLVVQDERLARDIHALATEYGKSNIYKAEPVKTEREG